MFVAALLFAGALNAQDSAEKEVQKAMDDNFAAIIHKDSAALNRQYTNDYFHSWSMATLALCLADLGKRAEADAVYEEMLARGRRQYVPPALLGISIFPAASTQIRDSASLPIKWDRELWHGSTWPRWLRPFFFVK